MGIFCGERYRSKVIPKGGWYRHVPREPTEVDALAEVGVTRNCLRIANKKLIFVMGP